MLEVLTKFLRRSVLVAFEDNPLRIVNVRRKNPIVELSLHRHFLFAPREVLCALADYVLGRRQAAARLKAYIYSTAARLPCSEEGELNDQGSHHNLSNLYSKMHEQYFAHADRCRVTWFAKLRNHPQRSITLGLYDATRQLIKVHCLLDRPEVPALFVEFVLYHEFLHSRCAPSIDERERLRVHTSEFKRAEKRFLGYAECMHWRREHLWALVKSAAAAHRPSCKSPRQLSKQ